MKKDPAPDGHAHSKMYAYRSRLVTATSSYWKKKGPHPMAKSPLEALLIAGQETRKKNGVKPGQPLRLGELKEAYFAQQPVSYQQPQPQAPRAPSEDGGKLPKVSSSTTKDKARFAPVTAPEKPVVEGDIESMMKAFKEGRRKK